MIVKLQSIRSCNRPQMAVATARLASRPPDGSTKHSAAEMVGEGSGGVRRGHAASAMGDKAKAGEAAAEAGLGWLQSSRYRPIARLVSGRCVWSTSAPVRFLSSSPRSRTLASLSGSPCYCSRLTAFHLFTCFSPCAPPSKQAAAWGLCGPHN